MKTPIYALIASVALLLLAACSSNTNQPVDFVTAWGSEGTGDGQFLFIEDFAFDAQGNLLVTDALRKDIQVFTPDGQFMTRFGQDGTGDAVLEKPEGVGV